MPLSGGCSARKSPPLSVSLTWMSGLSPSPLVLTAPLIPPCAQTEWLRLTGTMEKMSTCLPASASLMTVISPASPPPTTMYRSAMSPPPCGARVIAHKRETRNEGYSQRKWSAVEEHMEKIGPRSYGRSVLRGYVAEMRRAGLYDQVRARASAELATCMEDPRGVPAWLGPATLDELLAIVGGLRGRDAVGALSYHTMKGGGFKSVLEPIIHLSLSMLGANPGSLFSRADTMVSLVRA